MPVCLSCLLCNIPCFSSRQCFIDCTEELHSDTCQSLKAHRILTALDTAQLKEDVEHEKSAGRLAEIPRECQELWM